MLLDDDDLLAKISKEGLNAVIAEGEHKKVSSLLFS